jgi:hypothetical protein
MESFYKKLLNEYNRKDFESFKEMYEASVYDSTTDYFINKNIDSKTIRTIHEALAQKVQ